jgi:hypothetical protein
MNTHSIPVHRHQPSRMQMHRQNGCPKQSQNIPPLLPSTQKKKEKKSSTYISFLTRQISLQPILSSLTDALSPRLTHAVDVLVFNPPYVPTTPPEATYGQARGDISGSWAGGIRGMQVAEQLFERLEVRYRVLPSCTVVSLIYPHHRHYNRHSHDLDLSSVAFVICERTVLPCCDQGE